MFQPLNFVAPPGSGQPNTSHGVNFRGFPCSVRAAPVAMEKFLELREVHIQEVEHVKLLVAFLKKTHRARSNH